MLSSLVAFTPSFNGAAALSSAPTQRVATPAMQYMGQPREPVSMPGWGHDFKQDRGVTTQLAQRPNRGMDPRFTGNVMPTGGRSPVGGPMPPGLRGGPLMPGFGAPTMSESEVARLNQEVEEAE